MGCQRPPSPGTNAHPEAAVLQPTPAACSLLRFLPPTPFLGSCKSSWDFTRSPQQRSPPPASPRSLPCFPTGSRSVGKGKDFSTAGPVQHRANQPERLFPTVFILKIKSYRSAQPPLGCRGRGGEADPGSPWGKFHLRHSRRPHGTCLHKHLRAHWILRSWPSPAPSIRGCGKAEPGMHGAKESREGRAGGGARGTTQPGGGGLAPFPGEISHGEVPRSAGGFGGWEQKGRF